MAMTTTQMSEMYRFFIVAFGAAPGVYYMNQLDEALSAGMTTKQIVNVFTAKDEFTSVYPGFLSPQQFAERLIENVVKSSASTTAKAGAVSDVVAALASGMSRGDVIYNVFTNIAAKSTTDATWGNLVKQMNNQVAAADYYTSTLLQSSTDLAVLRSVVAGITDTQAGASQASLTYSAVKLEESGENDGSIDASILITVSGDKFNGSVGSSLGTLTNVPSGLVGTVVKSSDYTATLTLTGNAQAHATLNSTSATKLTLTGDSFLSALVPGTGSTQSFSLVFRDIWPVVESGVLTLEHLPQGNLVVDLTKDSVTQGGTTISPYSGSLSSATSVDLSSIPSPSLGQSSYTVSVIGGTEANSFVASVLGDVITPGGGIDSVTLGEGSDSIKFFNSSTSGFITIQNFNPLNGGDSLDFSAFLTQSSTGRVRYVDTNEGALDSRIAWTSGDRLIALGSSSMTASDVAALFDDYFQSPSTAARLVVMTGDVTGDTKIWYVTNASGTGASVISESEVRQVGVLKDVGAIDMTGSLVSYSTTTLVEASTNSGKFTESFVISLTGDTFRGTVGAKIGTVSNVPTGLTATLVKVSDVEASLTLSGSASVHAPTNSISNLTVTFTASNFSSGTTPVDAVRTNLSIEFRDLWPTVSSDTLTVSQTPTGDFEVNLVKGTITDNESTVEPVSGDLTDVLNVDLSGMSSLDADDFDYITSIVGTSGNNTIKASPFGDSITSNGGIDTITLGDGQDTVVFFKESVSGTVTLEDFTPGTDGDILDFSDFLLQTGTGNFTFVDTNQAASATPTTWSNGDILMALTDADDDETSIAALFGTYFANPTTAGKLVLMTADVTGDTSIWYIINKSGDGVDEITEDEIIRVGVLKDVNNYELAGFVSGNFI